MRKSILFLLFTQLGGLAQVPNMLKDITPGASSTQFSGSFYVMPNANILFGAGTPSLGNAGIWVSDGSTGGTILLNHVIGGNFLEYQGKTYFTGNKSGYQLWRTDGTIAGTDSVSTPGLTGAANLTLVNNILVMKGNTTEIWRSDGTPAGTYTVATGLNNIQFYNNVNNVLYFRGTSAAGGTELWRTDGTTAGTFMVKDIWAGAGSSFTTNPIYGVQGNNVFFLANDGVAGTELWKTDGTSAGTQLMADINPGTASSAININSFYIGNNGVYFMASNPTFGNELWFSDGTSANTQLIKDVGNGTLSAIPSKLMYNGNYAYYFYPSTGIIFKTDGTSAGTTTLGVIPTYTNPSITHRICDDMLRMYNNELYYIALKSFSNPGPQDSLFFNKVDLNLSSNTVVDKIYLNPAQFGSLWASINGFHELKGSSFIYGMPRTGSGDNFDLIIFNPAHNRHTSFYNLGNGNNVIYPHIFPTGISNKFYIPFWTNDLEPAYIDVTKDSLYLLKNINPGTGLPGFGCVIPPSPSYWYPKLFTLNNKIYFLANEQGYGVEFFESDFTQAGTFRCKDIYPGGLPFDKNNSVNNCNSGSFLIQQTPYNIFFGADDGNNGFELWSFVNSPNPPPPPPPPPTNTTSINETIAESQDVRIFPNPAWQVLNIVSNYSISSVAVYNALGSRVKTFAPTMSGSAVELTIADLAKGIYFVEIKTAKGSVTKRFVKD